MATPTTSAKPPPARAPPPQARAEQGLREMIRTGQPITFRGLAQTAGVSLDFLYRARRSANEWNNSAPNSRTPPPAAAGARPRTTQAA